MMLKVARPSVFAFLLISGAVVFILSLVHLSSESHHPAERLNPKEVTKSFPGSVGLLSSVDRGDPSEITLHFFPNVVFANEGYQCPAPGMLAVLRTSLSLPHPLTNAHNSEFLGIVPSTPETQDNVCFVSAALAALRILQRLQYRRIWVRPTTKHMVHTAAKEYPPGPRPLLPYKPGLFSDSVTRVRLIGGNSDDTAMLASYMPSRNAVLERIPMVQSFSTSPFLIDAQHPRAVDLMGQSTVIALGNMPLDPCTPSIAAVRNAQAAASLYRATQGRSRIVFSGGTHPDGGGISEAVSMQLVAAMLGVPCSDIVTEQASKTTRQNARFTAHLLYQEYQREQGVNPGTRDESGFRDWLGTVFLVSKMEHLEWALPIFRSEPLFADVPFRGMPAPVTMDEVAHEFQAYLNFHDSEWVSMRLKDVQRGRRGID